MAVAYSGGRDSTALLFACARVAQALGGVRVMALHVHHGISAQADAWAQHAHVQCDQWSAEGLPLQLLTRRLTLKIAAGQSVEAVARDARYQALAEMAREAGADRVLLAHHRQDQAETFLLQAMRGAGVAGLAAMPAAAMRDSLCWLRPWLDQERAEIEAYVREMNLPYVDDDTNADTRYARNRLRLDVMPVLRSSFPQVDQALAHAAQHSADAAWCLSRWADRELADLSAQDRQGLDAGRLAAREPAERRELLRHWYLRASGQALSRAWVQRLDLEVPRAVRSGQPAQWPEVALGVYRGVLSWHGGAGPVSTDGDLTQLPAGVSHFAASKSGHYTAPGWQGVLCVEEVAADEGGIPWAQLAQVLVRGRIGGEDFQMAANRPARSLKKQFQSAAVPAWLRHSPLFFAGEQLAFVPGLGMDARVVVLDPAQSRARLSWLSLPSSGGKG